MLARCKELIPLVDGGDVRSVHDDVFLHQAQPAAVGGGVEVGVGGQRLPRDVEGAVGILELPDMTSQTGVNPFGTVFEAGLVVPVPHFEGVGCEADVRGVWLALLLHLGLIQDVGVLAPCPLDRTVDSGVADEHFFSSAALSMFRFDMTLEMCLKSWAWLEFR